MSVKRATSSLAMQEILNFLERKHILYSITNAKGKSLRKMWERNFAGELSYEAKKSIYFN